MKIHIYYRHASSNTVLQSRPNWFSYESCFQNLLNTISEYDNVYLTLALDGDITYDFTKNYQQHFSLFQTNYQSSLYSYRALLEFIKTQNIESGDLIYFLENDYLHLPGWVDKIIELFTTYNGLDYVSLYDHNDKYFLPMYDSLVSKIFTTNTHHWRTTPSTCGSFIITKQLFDDDYDIWSTAVGDHETFLYLNRERRRFVYTPVPGLSTHCMGGLLSPTINWEQYANSNT
jgi:hypothetical protein